MTFITVLPLRLLARSGAPAARFLMISLTLMSAATFAQAHGDHDHEKPSPVVDNSAQAADHYHGEDDDHDHQDRVTFTPAQLQKMGIQTAIASQGNLQQVRSFRAQVMFDPRQQRRVHARFPGMVKNIRAQQGSNVQAGSELASIEANESLRTYSVTAPISGLVLEQSYQTGELTAAEPLFVLANTEQLLLTFAVFSRDVRHLQAGQTLMLSEGGRRASLTLESILPDSQNPSLYQARAVLDNSNGQWQPGEWLNAVVPTASWQGVLTIERRALQTRDGREVVFVREGNDFVERALVVGNKDQQRIQVLSGLQSGEEYVSANSYLIKAELEKSGAAHVH
jgi:cobalt-zinc-cadmium efflux system membrane fusion protein